MGKTAFVWIRDGVLVDRMHINPVAFAFAALCFATKESKRRMTLGNLITFAFDKSGFSCAEKLAMYNAEKGHSIEDVEGAQAFYNEIASQAAAHARYFKGAPQLLKDLHDAGACNFITSAVEQNVLDAWAETEQGKEIAPYLTEILGKRPGFAKGKEHFEHIRQRYHCDSIYYVADAPSEIETGARLAGDYGITAIGFGFAIGRSNIEEALALVKDANADCGRVFEEVPAIISDIRLPAASQVESALLQAGAETVVTGDTATIMGELRRYLFARQIL